MTRVEILPVEGIPEVREGDDVAALVAERARLEDGDVVVVAQKVVSKAEGRVVRLDELEPSAEAVELAGPADDPRRLEAILRESAHVEDGLANWPPRPRPDLPGPDGQIRVQWCAGAPGIVIAASEYLDEDLLLAGAELVWRAGPHAMEKGPCICHGTAGSGYALLAAFSRTGDERWLGRARRFAMHALEQVERGRAERGRGRYSLWTGDTGAALFAADCLDSTTAYPVVGSLAW